MGAPQNKQPGGKGKQQRGAGVLPEGLAELHAAQQLTKYNLGRPAAVKTLAKDQKRHSRDTLLQERLVQEHFARFNPPEPEAEDLIKQGVALEDAGRLEEAVKVYEKVLRAEPENLELRKYIGGVTSQINDKYAQMRRSQQMTADLATLTASPQNGKFGMASLLQPELAGNRQPQQAPLRKAQGNYTPKAAYAAELQQQMAENQRRRAEQAAKEKLQEKKELEAHLMRENLEKYNAHVGKGNDQLAFGLQQAQQRQYVKEQRRERWQEESGQARQYSTAGVGGVFAGEGERETVVRQYEQQMQQYNTAMLQQQQYQSQLQHQYQQQQQYQPQQQQYNQQYQQPQQHQQAYAQARPASSSAYYPAAPAAQARSSGAFAAQAAGPSSPSPAQQPSYLTASGGPTYHVLSVSPGETAAAPSPTRAFNPRKMDEQQRQARYPGIRPKSAVTVRPAAPFDRPGVDRPVAAINPAAVNDRAHAWAAARQPKPAPPQDKYLPAPGQQRPSDVNGIYADMVADQLKKAAVKGAGRRVRAEAPPRGLA